MICAADRPERFPPAALPEIAFLGRSNVGKSSLINALAGRKRVAFTSRTPGRTQTINFYRVEQRLVLVDLPGYGYAKVSREMSLRWRELIEGYLKKRDALALCVLIVDARRGWMPQDLQLREWLEFHGRQYLIAATKIDKLKTQSERHRGLSALVAAAGGAPVAACSAVTGEGVREIWQTISKIQKRA